MPLVHLAEFRVRYYECDEAGYLRPASFLRYMQEAAFDASAAAGYNFARYEAIERFWLIRETDIQVLTQPTYGDQVQVKTWVADFRRVRSRRAYEFRRPGTSDIIAQAQTDWVFLDRTSLRPVSIPPEMKTSFCPEGAPAMPPHRKRFPEPPPPPAHAYRSRRRVEWGDLDGAGHVNNAVYLDYLGDLSMQHTAASGWPASRMAAEGFAVVGRRYQIEYRQPAVLGDVLEIETWLSDIGNTALRHYTLARTSDRALIARARTTLGTVDGESRQSIPMPAPFVADLATE
jgi:acyl-CoA thioester hydrolase